MKAKARSFYVLGKAAHGTDFAQDFSSWRKKCTFSRPIATRLGSTNSSIWIASWTSSMDYPDDIAADGMSLDIGRAVLAGRRRDHVDPQASATQ